MELSTSAVVQAVSLVHIHYTNLVLNRLYFSIVVVRIGRQWFELEHQRFGHSLERQWFEHLLERQRFGHLLERQWGLYKQYMQRRSVEYYCFKWRQWFRRRVVH